jgi:hypothetical protein
MKKNTEALLVASKETSLEVNAEKTKSMFMSRQQNARQNHDMKTDNTSFKNVAKFKYLETTLPLMKKLRAEGVREYGAQEDIWAYEGGSKRRIDKMHSEELHEFVAIPLSMLKQWFQFKNSYEF